MNGRPPPELERLAAALSVEVRKLLSRSDDLPAERAVRRVPQDRSVPIGAVSGLYNLVVQRMEELTGCTEGSVEEAELARLAEVVATYEQATGLGPILPSIKRGVRPEPRGC